MSGVYTQKTSMSATQPAKMRRFTSASQMPPEMAAVAAWHFGKQRAAEAVEQETQKKRNDAAARREERRARDAQDAAAIEKGLEPEMRMPQLREEHARKIQFCRLVEARNRDEYEDGGSETDISEGSDGHYSDETSEERRARVAGVEEQKAKRIQRLREIQMKNGIKH